LPLGDTMVRMVQLKTYKSLTHTIRSRTARPRRKDLQLLSAVKELVPASLQLPDAQIAAATLRLRDQIAAGADPLSEDILVPSFALTAAAAHRVLSIDYYDVQYLAGFVLATGAVAEMKTGEGKTLVVALPAVLHALSGRGVHIATVNQYLAERDFRLLRPVFELLGITSGLAEESGTPLQNRTAYCCDVTYATGYQFGFDYLRDQLSLRERLETGLGQNLRNRLRAQDTAGPELLQRERPFAIID
jgi:preprotein translocase subunit SecA